MPKFYLVSKSPYTFEEHGHMQFYDDFHGPFSNNDEIDADVIKRHISKDNTLLVIEAEVRNVARNPKEKPEKDKRSPGNESNWKKTSENPIRWECKECGATILGAKVAHPIHDGPIPGSGSGECEYEDVGYCPNCETKPSFSGAPIRRPWGLDL